MRSLPFIVFAACAVMGTAILHIYSYFREVPSALLTTVNICSVLLFLSLSANSFWAMRGRKLPEAIQAHWREVMIASPRALQLIFFPAWVAAAVALVRAVRGGEVYAVHFSTAWCLGVSTMALAYALGLRRLSAAKA